MEKYDIIIIGAGPAGYTAALYAVRYSMRVLVIGADPGGYMKESHGVENWPGEILISGSELMQKFHEQMEHWEIDFKQDFVTKVEESDEEFVVHVGNTQYKSDSVVLTNGSKRRELNIPGEKELMGRGVSVCATCDAAFFKNKVVAVVGGGDAAMHSAVVLSKIAKKVYVIHRKNAFRAEQINIDHAKTAENVEFVMNASLKSIDGEKKIEGVTFNKAHEKYGTQLPLEGLFIEIGFVPDNTFANQLGVELNKQGFIVVSKGMETNVPGVYAAGDITDMPQKQAITAAGDASRAALSAYNYVSKIKHKKHEQ